MPEYTHCPTCGGLAEFINGNFKEANIFIPNYMLEINRMLQAHIKEVKDRIMEHLNYDSSKTILEQFSSEQIFELYKRKLVFELIEQERRYIKEIEQSSFAVNELFKQDFINSGFQEEGFNNYIRELNKKKED